MYTKPIARRSVVDPGYLAYCLSGRYDMGEWTECVYWLRGLNDTYRIRTASGLCILRVYRAAISESDVSYELSMLVQVDEIVRASRTKVSMPIRQRDGGLYTVIDAPEAPRVAVVFDYISGVENVLHDAASCYAFGQSAAELHAAMDQVAVDQPLRYELDTDFLIDQPLERIVQYIGAEHEAVPLLTEYASALKARVQEAARQGLDWGLCHGDMHGNNNAFQVDEGYIHYDFEWTAKGWRAYDLAQVKARKRQPAKELQQELWDALMAGYRSVRSFSALDEQAVELFIAVRRLWVMSLDVAFIPSDSGALDYGEDWLHDFVEEFRARG